MADAAYTIEHLRPHANGGGTSNIRATSYVYRDPTKIPVRQWVYGKHLIRRFLSTTVAPGAVGKSSLVLVEAIAMATGRPLLGVAVPKRLRVWYWNGEDPLEEIERRVAAICIHYGIDGRDLEDFLFLDSGRTSSIPRASPYSVAGSASTSLKLSAP